MYTTRAFMTAADNGSVVVTRKDPLTINTFRDAVAEIEASLFNLRHLAATSNFDDLAVRENFRVNVTELKRYYERAERIALDEQANSSGADGSVD
jgi:hypothetical protein